MRVFDYFNKVEKSVLKAFVISSALFAASEISLLLSDYFQPSFLNSQDFSKLISYLVSSAFCYFISVWCFKYKSFEKPFLCVVFFLGASVLSNTCFSAFWGICAGLLYSYIMKKSGKATGVVLCMVITAVTALLLRALTDLEGNSVAFLADFISDKGVASSVLFAVLKVLLSLFGFYDFENAFFFKSFGGTMISGSEAVFGLKNMLASGYEGRLLSQYMTGHFLYLFCLLGIFLFLFDQLRDFRRFSFAAVFAGVLLSGRIELILLFILMESPHLFLTSLLLAPLSYSTAYLVDIRMGYAQNGGITELLLNIDKPVYFFLCGVVLVAIGYFAARYSVVKCGLSSNLDIYIPKRLSALVDSLGGILNIIKVQENKVEVRNPQLVNSINLECEIHENYVTADKSVIDDLGDYL